MSGSSELEYRVRHTASSLFNAPYRPVGDKATRWVLVNNTNHYADIHGQVRACYSSRAVGPAKSPYYETYSTDWKNVMTTAPFPIAMREDGSSYRIRVVVGGAAENAAAACRFGVVLSLFGAPTDPRSTLEQAVAGTIPTDSVWHTDSATSGTTPAFLNGKSKGTFNWDRLIALTRDEAAPFLTVTGTPLDISGSSSGVPQCLVQLFVFAKTSNGLYGARLHYFQATEWYGEM